MKKQKKIMIVSAIMGILIIFFCWAIFFLDNKSTITGRAITNEETADFKKETGEKTIRLYFYDNRTNCPLNGRIYIDNNFLGDSKEGLISLKESYYKNYFKVNSSVAIYGLTDSCFGKDKNLPFAEYWIAPDLDYYFEYNETVPFEAGLTPRQPRYFEEMQGFIRPLEVKDYLRNELQKYLENNTKKDLDKIARHSFHYKSDYSLFNTKEYWQTPKEVLNKRYGDCEDWAVTVLSLMRVYNSSLKCYDVLWPTHLSIFCYVDGSYIIYDQDKTKSTTTLAQNPNKEYIILQENKIKLRKMLNNYFDDFGIKPKERRILALFNEKELITFEDNEDFIDWAIQLS